jgi:S-formylglutathione hydrolase FrmB
VSRNLWIVLLLLVCSGCRKPVQQATLRIVETNDGVTVTDVRFPSPDIDGMLSYRVIVPRATLGERFPTIYLLHGIESSPEDIMAHSDVVNLAAAARLVVVMPEAGYSYYTNARHKRHARWEDAITGELPRDVALRFPVLQGRANTGIAGISMGGYGAVKVALKHPDQYAFAGDMSGPVDITSRKPSLRRWGQTWRNWMIFGVGRRTRREEDVFELLGRSTQAVRVRWFESCGQQDPLFAVNQRFARELLRRGAALDRMTTPGGHDWQSWSAAMPQLLRDAERALR